MSLQKDLRQAQQLDAVVANAEAGATRRRPTRTAPSLESVVMDIVRASEERLLKTIEGLEARLAVAEGRGAEDPAAAQSAATGGAEEPAAPPPVVVPPALRRDATASLEPLTYEEAFAELGGEAEVARVSVDFPRSSEDAAIEAELSLLLPRDFQERRGFSTKLVNQAYVSDLETLYAQAARVYPSFAAKILDLGAALGHLGARADVAPLKSMLRARMKAAFKYGRHPQGGRR